MRFPPGTPVANLAKNLDETWARSRYGAEWETAIVRGQVKDFFTGYSSEHCRWSVLWDGDTKPVRLRGDEVQRSVDFGMQKSPLNPPQSAKKGAHTKAVHEKKTAQKTTTDDMKAIEGKNADTKRASKDKQPPQNPQQSLPRKLIRSYGKSGYKGVHQQVTGATQERFRMIYRNICCGIFDTKEEAAEAYHDKVLEVEGIRGVKQQLLKVAKDAEERSLLRQPQPEPTLDLITSKRASSGYKGVYGISGASGFRVIGPNSIVLGSFKTKEEAATAYRRYIDDGIQPDVASAPSATDDDVEDDDDDGDDDKEDEEEDEEEDKEGASSAALSLFLMSANQTAPRPTGSEKMYLEEMRDKIQSMSRTEAESELRRRCISVTDGASAKLRKTQLQERLMEVVESSTLAQRVGTPCKGAKRQRESTTSVSVERKGSKTPKKSPPASCEPNSKKLRGKRKVVSHGRPWDLYYRPIKTASGKNKKSEEESVKDETSIVVGERWSSRNKVAKTYVYDTESSEDDQDWDLEEEDEEQTNEEADTKQAPRPYRGQKEGTEVPTCSWCLREFQSCASLGQHIRSDRSMCTKGEWEGIEQVPRDVVEPRASLERHQNECHASDSDRERGETTMDIDGSEISVAECVLSEGAPDEAEEEVDVVDAYYSEYICESEMTVKAASVRIGCGVKELIELNTLRFKKWGRLLPGSTFETGTPVLAPNGSSYALADRAHHQHIAALMETGVEGGWSLLRPQEEASTHVTSPLPSKQSPVPQPDSALFEHMPMASERGSSALPPLPPRTPSSHQHMHSRSNRCQTDWSQQEKASPGLISPALDGLLGWGMSISPGAVLSPGAVFSPGGYSITTFFEGIRSMTPTSTPNAAAPNSNPLRPTGPPAELPAFHPAPGC